MAVERLGKVNSEVQVETLNTLLTSNNAFDLIDGCQCAVDCLDNVAARFQLARACQEAGIPVVYGAIAGWFGQVCTVFPSDVSFVTLYGAHEDSDSGEGAEKPRATCPSRRARSHRFRRQRLLRYCSAGRMSFATGCL